ncbi:hypothetical protein GCM10009119_21540 [Algoriphagus jejuensis]|uniref:Uncharacterized protein n=1 Tax=Algoriphagus jejuensis TaxID=419934 RepID=A0ABP3YET8_9BACT
MHLLKGYLALLLLTFSLSGATAQEGPPPVKNDSITLAQAYINLTLTKEYFEGISVERISNILPFEKMELASITDSAFIRDNAALYHFSYSLLYYNQAKLLFRTKKNTDRETLIDWKNSLEKAIENFYSSKRYASWEQDNSFFDLIKFEERSYTNLHKELFDLKSFFTPYFNQDILPDFKRIFLKAKNSDKFETDSLSYFANIYSFEYNFAIVEREFDSNNYDFGPNTLALPSEYGHFKKNYNYNQTTTRIDTTYPLDDQLDLILRYVQLKRLASRTHSDSLSWFESYRLYNDYFIFRDQSEDEIFYNRITKAKDTFLKNELNAKELDLLYGDLKKKFSYAPYATAQAFINLSIIQAQFETQTDSRIASILALHEKELSEISDSMFIAENPALYDFTYSLLYENTARLLFRARKDVLRKTLVEWKETLERGIDHYNLSQKEREKTDKETLFYNHIKFLQEDVSALSSKITGLKDQFTPYFNEDIYPDFQRIFYKAKNYEQYDFEGLKAFAEIYGIRSDFSVLENKRNVVPYGPYNEISQSYEMLRELDLVSKFIQFKFLASDQFSVPSDFDVEELYYSYNEFINKLYHSDFFSNGERDEFILRELNSEAIETLFSQLQEKFPYDFNPYGYPLAEENLTAETENDLARSVEERSFFFPELAPLASASYIKRNFQPGLKTLGKVDDFLRKEFISAGYSNQLHYYYAAQGFAITTSLEKFNIDGSAVAPDKRFVKSLTGQKKLSYYEIFKSMFFDLESEYRMFALVIASNAVTMSKNGMTPAFAEQLIENSYDRLPADLTDKELPNKTLSVFVYHFHVNLNSGTVELDLSGKISAQEHLRKAGLLKIIQ